MIHKLEEEIARLSIQSAVKLLKGPNYATMKVEEPPSDN